jgi:hypothetical protein
MFQTKVVEKIKTHILCSITFFSRSRAIYETMWNNMVETDRQQMAIWRMRIACWTSKATHTHTHIHTHTHSHHTHTHTHTHSHHTHTHTHTHTHSHTHSQYVILIAFPLLQMLPERPSTLRYMYIDFSC